MKQLNVLDEVTGSEWDRLVRSHPDHTPFHCAAWARVICETYGHQARYLVCFCNNEAVALVPLIEVVSPFTGRRGVSLPFSDACGPLVFRDEASHSVGRELIELAQNRRWNYTEIRGGSPLKTDTEPTATFFGHSISLSHDREQILHQCGNGTRGAVRQALRKDVTAGVFTTADAIATFYELHVRTRRRHGVPPQPVRFFRKIHQHMVGTGHAFVVLAHVGGRAVAGALFLRSGNKATYKFAASDARYARTRANNLVIWEAIGYLIRCGCESLDFGRTSLANHGLRRFKLSWGAEEQMIPYYRFEGHREARVKGARRENSSHSYLFRHLPLAVNRLAGAILYPHLD